MAGGNINEQYLEREELPFSAPPSGGRNAAYRLQDSRPARLAPLHQVARNLGPRRND